MSCRVFFCPTFIFSELFNAPVTDLLGIGVEVTHNKNKVCMFELFAWGTEICLSNGVRWKRSGVGGSKVGEYLTREECQIGQRKSITFSYANGREFFNGGKWHGDAVIIWRIYGCYVTVLPSCNSRVASSVFFTELSPTKINIIAIVSLAGYLNWILPG